MSVQKINNLDDLEKEIALLKLKQKELESDLRKDFSDIHPKNLFKFMTSSLYDDLTGNIATIISKIFRWKKSK